MFIAKGLLDWMEFPCGTRETLYGHQFHSIRLNGEQKAGTNGFTVHQNGTGTADTMLTPNIGAAQSEVLTQEVREGLPHLHGSFMIHAVDA